MSVPVVVKAVSFCVGQGLPISNLLGYGYEPVGATEQESLNVQPVSQVKGFVIHYQVAQLSQVPVSIRYGLIEAFQLDGLWTVGI